MPSACETAADRLTATQQLQVEIERRLEAGPLELPMLPHVATQILAGGLNDTTDIRALSELLQRDQALAGHTLRVANSAAYGATARVQSIQQALFRIGLAQMREIVVAVALKSRVFQTGGHADLVGNLWQHSAVAGICAKEIARTLRYNVEGAFVCGLLHDVGKAVILALVLDVCRSTRTPVPREACLEILAHHHARIGRTLAERWALPEQVVESIALHHTPEAAERHGQAVQVTCLADLLAHAALASDETDETERATLKAHPVCGALNLYPEDLDALLDRRAAILELAGAFDS
jgi:putative nucleotidyltransferase with HDIG domain